MNEELKQKYDRLVAYVSELNKVSVAFSGGVDSTLLARVAFDALGNRAIAYTVRTELMSQREAETAQFLSQQIGIPHFFIKQSALKNEDIARNDSDRCYYCQKMLFSLLPGSVIIDGTTASDNLSDEVKKALQEQNVISPLKECGLTRLDVVSLSRELCLPLFERPSSNCLASRIPSSERLSGEVLAVVEQAETILGYFGFSDLRVTPNGEQAVVHILSQDMELYYQKEHAIKEQLRKIGFSDVVLSTSEN